MRKQGIETDRQTASNQRARERGAEREKEARSARVVSLEGQQSRHSLAGGLVVMGRWLG